MIHTEPAATSTPQATWLAGLFASAEPIQERVEYRGAFTPLELDARNAEIAALVSSAAVHDLGWMRRIALRGEDSFRWLSGMVTNTVTDLAANAGAWNLVLNAQGRIQGDLWAWRDGDSLEMEIAADQVEKLLAHLNRFIIMDDVELLPLESESAIGLTGPRADHILASLNLPMLPEPLTQVRTQLHGVDICLRRSYGTLAPHYELWAATESLPLLWSALRKAGAVAVGVASLDAFRIAEGIPAYGIDIAERDLPQETSQMRAISFSKGCYLGQEIVERIRSRGNVHRHLRPLELTGPLPAAGTELHLQAPAVEPGKAPGHITSAAELHLPSGRRVFALGIVRAEAEVGNRPLAYLTGSAAGAARILSAPPVLNNEPIGNQEL